MKKLRSFLLNFFLCPCLFFFTNEGYGQFSQAFFVAKGKADSVVLFFYSGQLHEVAEADRFIELQFRLENEPGIDIDSFYSSPLNQGYPDQQFYSTGFRFNDSSYYFTADSVNIGEIHSVDAYRLRNQDASIWRKMGRAQLFIGGTELLCMGILMAMPKEVTKWEPGFLESAKKNLKRAFTTMPENDKDDWGFNYVGHPIAGSLYYNSIRSQNATIFQSFLFSFAQSAIWEYVIEGMAEQPSLQDLIITPIFGTLLGEASHEATISMRRNGFNWLEKITVIIINPFFAVNNGFRTTSKKVITK
jgi:Domain of unknown function (DUF3943)